MDIPYTVSIRPDTGLYNGKLGIWLFLASEVMLFGAIFTAYLFVRIGADDGSWPNHIQNIWIGLLNTILLLTSSITMVWAWVALKERKFNTYRLALGLTILCGIAFLGLKSVEYYSKFHHYGLFIKQEAFEKKYQKQLEEAGAFSSFIPEQKLYEIRGHWENYAAKLPDNFTFTVLPDEAPKYAISFAKKKAEAAAQTTGTEEAEKTISIAKADVERSGYLLPAYGTYYAIYFLVTGLHAMHIVGGVVVMIYFFTIGAKMYRRNPEQLSNRVEVTGIFWHFVDLVWITVFPILYLT